MITLYTGFCGHTTRQWILWDDLIANNIPVLSHGLKFLMWEVFLYFAICLHTPFDIW